MICLPNTTKSWGVLSFKAVFKAEVELLDSQLLPLQQALMQGSYVSESKFSAMVLGFSEEAGIIFARAGIFYTSIIAGCNCADDPSPVDEQSEYCELQFEINKVTTEATVKLLA